MSGDICHFADKVETYVKRFFCVFQGLSGTFEERVIMDLKHLTGEKSCHAHTFIPDSAATLQPLRELYCSASEQLAGWTNYPVFLENYLSYFPKEQLLVVYTEQLLEHPSEVS